MRSTCDQYIAFRHLEVGQELDNLRQYLHSQLAIGHLRLLWRTIEAPTWEIVSTAIQGQEGGLPEIRMCVRAGLRPCKTPVHCGCTG